MWGIRLAAVVILCAVVAPPAAAANLPKSPTGPVSYDSSAAADWPQYQEGPAQDGYNNSETRISASNVGRLGLLWTGETGSRTYSPVVANGVIYTTDAETLYAFAVDCRQAQQSCQPLWQAAAGTWPQTPTVADGRVFVPALDAIYVFDAAGNEGCGGSARA